MEVKIGLIRPSPYQPRLVFDLQDLKREIERDGLLSDLVVRKRKGFYELIDGERRWRALKELGWKKIPVQIRDIDDRTARLTIYKLNTIRENYAVEERAKYFKKLNDGGMTFYQIGKELNVDDNWVLAHINVFKFQHDIQRSVWDGAITISHIQTLEPIIGANIEEASKIARTVIERRLSTDELRKAVSGRVKRVEEARVEAAKEAIEKIGVATPITVGVETPEELEKAAEALRREAKKRREEALTPKEKAALEAEKKRREEERQKAEQVRKRREEDEERRIEEEARKRVKQIEEAQRHRIEEEASRKAREEALKDRKFLEQARKVLIKQVPMRKVEREMMVKRGVNYTIGELDCERCGKHYVIKCNGRENWLE